MTLNLNWYIYSKYNLDCCYEQITRNLFTRISSGAFVPQVLKVKLCKLVASQILV